MPMIPAVCDNCSNIFSSGVFIENSTATFDNTRSGPCPYCGSMGHIPNGTFRVVQDVIEILSAPQRTIDELKRLKSLLQEATKKDSGPSKVVQSIENETPQISPLLSFLKNEEFRYWLPVMLTIINILIALHFSSKPEEPKVEINQVITKMIEQPAVQNPIKKIPVKSSTLSDASKKKPIIVEKIGRNTACFCGSGIKYKRCHGTR